jgi:uroporphyrinogen-III decarboxylase
MINDVMTSRQRVLAALRREEVDYVPCCASFNPLHEI